MIEITKRNQMKNVELKSTVIKKFTSEAQEQMWTGRRNNQQILKQINRDYSSWRLERKEIKENEHSLKEMWNTIKCTNIYVMELPKGREREKKFKEIMSQIYSKAVTYTPRKQEAQ